MAKSAANTKTTAKSKPRGKPWPKGVSGNPKGAPKQGDSWASVLTWASNLTGEEAAEYAPPELRQFFKPLKGLQLKQAISLRVMAALFFEPDAKLFNAVMDRIDGKVPNEMNLDWRIVLEKHGIDAGELFEQLVQRFVAAGVGAIDAGSDSGGSESESIPGAPVVVDSTARPAGPGL